jgi:dTDP-glucose 4,6-dehydratase
MPWHYVLEMEKPDVIINFAAETHVDNSITDAKAFIHSNYSGVHNLLVGLRRYIAKTKHVPLLIHMSTDEVYGDLPIESIERFAEDSPLSPNNPYSATKAAADLLIEAVYRTYKDFNYIICRPSNNYGPNQHMEKFLPTVIRSILNKEKIPVYGDGKNRREWLCVTDLARAIDIIMKKWYNIEGPIHYVYNIGSSVTYSNLTVVESLLQVMGASHKLISFVADRPGHDRKYSLDCAKAHINLGWTTHVSFFDDGLRMVIKDIKSRM